MRLWERHGLEKLTYPLHSWELFCFEHKIPRRGPFQSPPTPGFKIIVGAIWCSLNDKSITCVKNWQWEVTEPADVISHAPTNPNKNIISSKFEGAQELAGQVHEV